jgi:hypothetical protein
MLKLQVQFLIGVTYSILVSSCNQSDKVSAQTNIEKTDNYEVGDCFEFKEKIKDFGLIFLEKKTYSDGKDYKLFPVKLDTTKRGIEKFKKGKVYLTSFPDLTTMTGKTEGFMTYVFPSQKDFTLINQFCNYKGNIMLKDKYKNETGGLMASNMDEFRMQLNLWEHLFNRNGKLVLVEDICR